MAESCPQPAPFYSYKPQAKSFAAVQGAWMAEAEQFLTAADVAKVVGISPAGIRQAARSGRLPVVATTAGGVRLFVMSDVHAFNERRRLAALAAAHV